MGSCSMASKMGREKLALEVVSDSLRGQFAIVTVFSSSGSTPYSSSAGRLLSTRIHPPREYRLLI